MSNDTPTTIRKDQGQRLDVHNSDVPVLCRACEARHRGICGALDSQELIRLSRHTVKQKVESDSELVSAGADIRHYSNVLSGVVKLTRLMADGRQQIVGLQFAPDFVGRPFRQSSEVSAEAATEVKLCSFPKEVMDEMIAASPDLERRLYQQALDELGVGLIRLERHARGRGRGERDDGRRERADRDPRGVSSLARLGAGRRATPRGRRRRGIDARGARRANERGHRRANSGAREFRDGA